MRQGHRLRALHMRVAGHDGIGVIARDLEQRVAQAFDERDYCRNLIFQEQPKIQRDLIVA